MDAPHTLDNEPVLSYASPRRPDRSFAPVAAIVLTLSLIQTAWALYFAYRFRDDNLSALATFKNSQWPATVLTLIALPLAHMAVFAGTLWSLACGRLTRFAQWSLWTLIAALLLEAVCAYARLGPWDRGVPAYALRQLSRLAPALLPPFLLLLLSGKSYRDGRPQGSRVWWLSTSLCLAASTPMVYGWIAYGRRQWIESALDLDGGLHGDLFRATACLGQLSLDAAAAGMWLVAIGSLLPTRPKPTLIRACTTLMLAALVIRAIPLPYTIVQHMDITFQANAHRYLEIGAFLPLSSWNYWLDWEPTATLRERLLVGYAQSAASWIDACAFVITLRIALNRPEILAWTTQSDPHDPPPPHPPRPPHAVTIISL